VGPRTRKNTKEELKSWNREESKRIRDSNSDPGLKSVRNHGRVKQTDGHQKGRAVNTMEGLPFGQRDDADEAPQKRGDICASLYVEAPQERGERCASPQTPTDRCRLGRPPSSNSSQAVQQSDSSPAMRPCKSAKGARETTVKVRNHKGAHTHNQKQRNQKSTQRGPQLINVCRQLQSNSSDAKRMLMIGYANQQQQLASSLPKRLLSSKRFDSNNHHIQQ